MVQLIALLLLSSSFLGIGARAFTRFDQTCTLPTDIVNFVSAPNSRSTLEILWSCIFTIIACTWTIQHLNIPEQRDPYRKKSWRYRTLYAFKGFWTTLKWMLFTMLCPEYIFAKAIGELIFAWKLKKKVDKMKQDGDIEPDEEWGMSHGFFSFIGGFRVLEHDDSQGKKGRLAQEGIPTGEKQGYTLECVSTGGVDQEVQDPHTKKGKSTQDQSDQMGLKWNVPRIAGSRILSPDMLLSLRKAGLILRLPNITGEEIHDRSKANIFVKALAAIQVLWVDVQIIVRSTRGLAISQLELVVAAYSLCAFFTYLFLIPKPQSVQVPMRPTLIRPGSLERISGTVWYSFSSITMLSSGSFIDFQQEEVQQIPNDAIPGGPSDRAILAAYALGGGVGGMIFGAIHIAAWNFDFPTPIEREIWRIASILAVCIPPFAVLPHLALVWADKVSYFQGGIQSYTRIDRRTVLALGFLAWGFAFLMAYIVARLFLMVETFRSLGFLPPTAFVATWVSNIPSVG